MSRYIVVKVERFAIEADNSMQAIREVKHTPYGKPVDLLTFDNPEYYAWDTERYGDDVQLPLKEGMPNG